MCEGLIIDLNKDSNGTLKVFLHQVSLSKVRESESAAKVYISPVCVFTWPNSVWLLNFYCRLFHIYIYIYIFYYFQMFLFWKSILKTVCSTCFVEWIRDSLQRWERLNFSSSLAFCPRQHDGRAEKSLYIEAWRPALIKSRLIFTCRCIAKQRLFSSEYSGEIWKGHQLCSMSPDRLV